MLGARVSARPKLVSGGFASPQRAELGLAIAERQAAEEQLAKLEGAAGQLRDAQYAADEAVAAAAEALEVAKAAASQHVLASAIGEAGEAPQTVKAARAALLEAEDGLDAAKAARNGLSERIEAARSQVRRAADRAKDAALAVLLQSPAVVAVAEALEQAERDLADAGAAFAWFLNQGAYPRVETPGSTFGKPADRAQAEALRRYYTPANYWHELTQAMPGARPWEATLEALQVDANASLPGEGA